MKPPACTPGHDQSCRDARSTICTCRCGGWNHGNMAAWPKERLIERLQEDEETHAIVEYQIARESNA